MNLLEGHKSQPWHFYINNNTVKELTNDETCFNQWSIWLTLQLMWSGIQETTGTVFYTVNYGTSFNTSRQCIFGLLFFCWILNLAVRTTCRYTQPNHKFLYYNQCIQIKTFLMTNKLCHGGHLSGN